MRPPISMQKDSLIHLHVTSQLSSLPFPVYTRPVMITAGNTFLEGTWRPLQVLRSLPAARFSPLQGRKHLALYVNTIWGGEIAGV